MQLGPLLFSASAFWLAIPVLLALIIARFFRTRRREVVAGSLLLWKRLAAQQPKLPPRRVIIDASLLLQFAALLAIMAALAAPSWSVGGTHGREVLLVVDNGPLARARNAGGTPLLSDLRQAAELRLKSLKSNDRVFLARSSPTPKLLTPEALSPDAAKAKLAEIAPALSGPDAEALWRFCADKAHSLDESGSVRREVLSLRDGPPNLGVQWRCIAPSNSALNNVALVGTGSAFVPNSAGGVTEVLIRVKNFGAQPVDGSVTLTGLKDTKPADAAHTRTLHLDAHSDGSVVFTLDGPAKEALRAQWASSKPDVLPEDDVIALSPRVANPPRIRFVPASVPALEKLFREVTPPAVIVAPADTADVDLEIRTGNVPEAMPANAKALMLLSPETGFRSFFEVPGELKNPQPQKDPSDDLVPFVKSSADSLFAVPRAREIQVTGDMSVVIKDRVSGRPLIARFADERGHPVFLFAFVPGQGLPADRALEPELAAVLVSLIDRAAGIGEPFAFTTARELEASLTEPLPLAWSATADDTAKSGAGVLDESTSNLQLGKPTAALSSADDTEAWPAAARSEVYDLTPWCIVLAVCLMLYEQWRERPRAHTVKPLA